MSRNQLEDIWYSWKVSEQPEQMPPGMPASEYHWMLIGDMVKNFNEQREEKYNPSDKVTGDESIFKWYGSGGDWFNEGLPHYIAIDRKPEDGCELQNFCDGRSRVMMQIKVVKSPQDEKKKHQDTLEEAGYDLGDADTPHAAKVVLELLQPWLKDEGTQRLLCADSYFASVQIAQELKARGINFIGVIKTAARNFPM
jgi:hypothetical protein